MRVLRRERNAGVMLIINTLRDVIGFVSRGKEMVLFVQAQRIQRKYRKKGRK